MHPHWFLDPSRECGHCFVWVLDSLAVWPSSSSSLSFISVESHRTTRNRRWREVFSPDFLHRHVPNFLTCGCLRRMFEEACQRVRLMKNSEAVNIGMYMLYRFRHDFHALRLSSHVVRALSAMLIRWTHFCCSQHPELPGEVRRAALADGAAWKDEEALLCRGGGSSCEIGMCTAIFAYRFRLLDALESWKVVGFITRL